MQQPQFNIENYIVANNEIVVMAEKYSIGIPVTIPQDKFEWWLRVNNKLQWELKSTESQPITGTMSLDEYWNTDSHFIRQDLYQYISSNPIKRDDVVYSNSLDSLNLAFDLHNAQRINPVFNTRWEHDQEIFSQVFN